MNGFLSKIAMLVMFLLAVSCIWAAITMVFHVGLFNILLAILGAFFLLRGFELADKVNKLGPYSEDNTPGPPQPQDKTRTEGEETDD